tara:strand:+ start:57 stop:1076 length:1020 start_codon:yes stop_codon:yes gene_type:complete
MDIRKIIREEFGDFDWTNQSDEKDLLSKWGRKWWVLASEAYSGYRVTDYAMSGEVEDYVKISKSESEKSKQLLYDVISYYVFDDVKTENGRFILYVNNEEDLCGLFSKNNKNGYINEDLILETLQGYYEPQVSSSFIGSIWLERVWSITSDTNKEYTYRDIKENYTNVGLYLSSGEEFTEELLNSYHYNDKLGELIDEEYFLESTKEYSVDCYINALSDVTSKNILKSFRNSVNEFFGKSEVIEKSEMVHGTEYVKKYTAYDITDLLMEVVDEYLVLNCGYDDLSAYEEKCDFQHYDFLPTLIELIEDGVYKPLVGTYDVDPNVKVMENWFNAYYKDYL